MDMFGHNMGMPDIKNSQCLVLPDVPRTVQLFLYCYSGQVTASPSSSASDMEKPRRAWHHPKTSGIQGSAPAVRTENAEMKRSKHKQDYSCS